MRDPIVSLALAGTSRQEDMHLTTGTPVDALLAELPEGEVEHTFLLSAGAWAIYRQAGTQAQSAGEMPLPADEEALPACSPNAALLIPRLLTGEQTVLLYEALEILRQKGQRLPFRLLPQALNASSRQARTALFPLLGERGRWLSQFNPSWRWVQNHLAADEGILPADAEKVWQEGTAGQRVEILRRLRAVDPGKALTWLEAVWKQEKAETRADMLNTLKVGLNAADEPFLENALDDRAGSVRSAAVTLLTRLPGSALGERARQRGRQMVQMVDGQIRVELPSSFVPAWQRDGMVEGSPRRAAISERSWWLFQTLETIDPAFWESHLGAPPARLIDLFPADDGSRVLVIEGWSKAAQRFQALSWLAPLWSWWYQHFNEFRETRLWIEQCDYHERLLPQMPSAAAEQLLLDLIDKRDGTVPAEWPGLAATLPQPWSVHFARIYLRHLRENCTVEKMEGEAFDPYGNPWLHHLSTVALALPVACLAEAGQSWHLADHSKWQVQYAIQIIRGFVETVHMRQKIHEEI